MLVFTTEMMARFHRDLRAGKPMMLSGPDRAVRRSLSNITPINVSEEPVTLVSAPQS